MPYDITHGLQSLENVWSYAKAYADLRGIYALYQTFRRFQSQQTMPGRIPSPKQAWLDLTQAIIDDPRNIKESISHIDQLVVKKNLFNDSLKVKF